MKIYCKEKGREVIYVQVSDLYLLDILGKLPLVVKLKALSKPIISIEDITGVVNYVAFDEPRFVSYFKAKEEITDFTAIKDLPINKLEDLGKSLLNELNSVKDIFLLVPSEETNKLSQLKNIIEFLKYKVKEFNNIYCAKRNGRKLPLPLLMVENGFSNECEEYEINRSLSPHQLLISRKDGESIKNSYDIPVEFITDSVNLAIEDDINRGEDFSNGSYFQFNLSEDSRYIVVDYGPKLKSRLKPRESILKKLFKPRKGKRVSYF